MFKRLIFFSCCLASICGVSAERLLSLKDVRLTMDEMFSYHVEHKEFSPLLAKRSCRLLVEQFDFHQSYLLKEEAEAFLSLNDETVNQIVKDYSQGKFDFYAGMHSRFCAAIWRSRKIRKAVGEEILLKGSKISQLPLAGLDSGYAVTEEDLKRSLSQRMLRSIQLILKRREMTEIDPNTLQKMINYYENKQRQMETEYMQQHAPLAAHFLAFHLLKALAKSLDAHSSYYSPDEAARIRVGLQKQFCGVGIIVQEDFDAVHIREVIPGGSAARSGRIDAGDTLVAIDYRQIDQLTFKEVLKKLTGEEGSAVTLGLKKKEGKVAHVPLTREKITMHDQRLSVKAEPFGKGVIGKISLPAFYDNGGTVCVEKDMKEAIRALQKEGDLLGLVIDVRENAGGFLKQAVKACEMFIQSGVIVVSKYARNEVNYALNLSGRKLYDGPLVVLTSKASASAAEIFAQALQDHGVALIVGDERSYGKGSMQHQTITDPRAKSFFKVTVGRYYTASGRSPQIEGVESDLVVPTRYFPYRIGERYLAFPLSRDQLSRDIFQALKEVRKKGVRTMLNPLVVPYLKPRESEWRAMLPRLLVNSAKRLSDDPNFQLFLKVGKQRQQDEQEWLAFPAQNAGVDDLQLKEAVMIIKDMIGIKQARSLLIP